MVDIEAICGQANIEGDVCKLPAGHDVHQDGTGDDWGVRWGYAELDLSARVAVLEAAQARVLALCDGHEGLRFAAEFRRAIEGTE